MMRELLPVAHLIGIALAVGAGTTKLLLLLKASRDHGFVPTYIRVARPITHVILAGMALLVISGVAWIWTGHPVTTRLWRKLVAVAAIFAIGPVLDKVVEPRYRALADAPDASAKPAFRRVQRQYIALELAANVLFYGVIVYWKLFW